MPPLIPDLVSANNRPHSPEIGLAMVARDAVAFAELDTSMRLDILGD